MNNRIPRIALVAIVLACLGAMSACDKAQETLKSTDLGAAGDVGKLLSKAAEAFGGITDVESAKAALPQLKGLDGDLGQLVEKFAAMDPAKKEKLLGAVSSARPQLEKAMARIENMAGVGEIVGPTLSSFRAKLEQLH
ncbi:hypothetical protein KDM41_14980 [bacterium]|nr:hypothetical protein [bacterium]